MVGDPLYLDPFELEPSLIGLKMGVQTFVRSVFIRSWWVIAFLLGCAVLYEQGLKEQDQIYHQLTDQRENLRLQKEEALRHQENLKLQINSQSDLAWVELTLMKGLGLVPEGQKKVYFYEDNPL
jgi:hypothetical protein